MKRRSFLQAVLGLFAAPVAAKAPLPEVAAAEELTSFSMPIVIDQFRSAGALGSGSAEFGVSVRELYKADLAQQFANEFDRRVFESLAGGK